jgi:hypothetical protein
LECEISFGKHSPACLPSLKIQKKDGEIPQPFLKLFLLLWPGDWKQQPAQMNEDILKEYKTKSKNKVGIHSIRPVTQREFFIFIGIIIFSEAIKTTI